MQQHTQQQQQHLVDLNCDMGESFGVYSSGADDDLFAHISSANIACGFHAGDPSVMRRCIARAARAGVATGAHPGLPDLAGFGRRAMAVTAEEVYDMTVYQIGALGGFATAAGTALAHVKPHGALYNMAAADDGLADAIARAVHDVDADLALFGLAGSALIRAGERLGLRTASEVFADRHYTRDGHLVPRSRADALVTDASEAVRRTLRMVREGRVRSADGDDIAVRADTVCIHGDGVHAADFARQLRAAFDEAPDITVRAVGRRDSATVEAFR